MRTAGNIWPPWGSIITKHGLDFDSRTYGYAKLSDLLLRRHLPREMDW